MYSALGKNGQFLNVVPSQNLVLIRMGDEPSGALVPLLMNDKIWEYMNALTCNSSNINELEANEIQVFPNPSKGIIQANQLPLGGKIVVADASGRILKSFVVHAQNASYSLEDLSAGSYFMHVYSGENHLLQTKKVILD
jgi:hypothetical protein